MLLSVLKNIHAVSGPDRVLPLRLKQSLHRHEIPVRQLHRVQSLRARLAAALAELKPPRAVPDLGR
jgi:hypothetical protein